MTKLTVKGSIKGSIMQRTPEGLYVGIEFEGKVLKIAGPVEQALGAVLEAEMHGNAGKSEIHLILG